MHAIGLSTSSYSSNALARHFEERIYLVSVVAKDTACVQCISTLNMIGQIKNVSAF